MSAKEGDHEGINRGNALFGNALFIVLASCFALLALVSLSASPAFAVRALNCSIDNCNGLVSYYPFNDTQWDDSFSSTSVNTSRWAAFNYGAGAYSFTGSVLHLSGSAYGGGTSSGIHTDGYWMLTGDFDIQFDYSNLVAPSAADGGVQFVLYTKGPGYDDGFYVRRQRSGRYDSSTKINSVWDAGPGYAYVNTGDTSGKLRITRSGNTLSAYYWSGSSWSLLRTATHVEYYQPMYVFIEQYYSSPSNAHSVDIDNVIVNKGEFTLDTSGNAFVANDNFTTTILDTNKWSSVTWGNIGTDGSELFYNVTTGSGWRSSGINSRYVLRGDFDIQEDFSGFEGGGVDDGGVFFDVLSAADNDYMWIRRYNTNAVGYQLAASLNGAAPSQVGSTYTTTDTAGKFRLTRVGNTLSGYFWSGSSWTLIGSVSNTEYLQDMIVRTELGSNTPTTLKKVRIDNFKINSGTVVAYPGPTGVVTNAAWTTGPLGYAAGFDGSDSLVNLGSQFTYQNFSISMWLKPNTTQVTNADIIDNNHGGDPSFTNWVVQQDGTNTNKYFVLTFGTDNSACYTFFNLTPDVWQHVALVREYGGIKAYVNGVLASSSTANCNVPIKYSSPSLTLGRHASNAARTWKGSMDDVSFWSRPLTTSEIRTMNGLGPLNLPNVTTFITGTTNFSALADVENVPNVTLVTATTAVRWTGLINASGKDFDQYVNMGPGFVSLDVAALGQTVNTTAVVNITGINCENFDLYYATGVHSSLASLKASGVLVATQQNLNGNCLDATKCTAISCANGVLTFTAQHFDGFGGDNGTDQPVPEFGTWALMIALGLTIGGFVAVRNRKN